MTKLIDKRHVRFVVMDRDDEDDTMCVQDIVETYVGAAPFFWRRWLRQCAGRPAAKVIVETLTDAGEAVHVRTVMLADYARADA